MNEIPLSYEEYMGAVQQAKIDAFRDIFMRDGKSEKMSVIYANKVVSQNCICDNCKKIYLNDSVFCGKCGNILVGVKISTSYVRYLERF